MVLASIPFCDRGRCQAAAHWQYLVPARLHVRAPVDLFAAVHTAIEISSNRRMKSFWRVAMERKHPKERATAGGS
jgi:hypothetical protein